MVARPGLGHSSDRDPPLLIGGKCHSRYFPIPYSDSSPNQQNWFLKTPSYKTGGFTNQVVARPGLEPGTHRFSVYCSTNWAIPPLGSARIIEKKEKKQVYLKKVLIIFFSKGICDIRFSIITCKKTEYFSFWWKEFSLQGAWLEWWTFTNNSSNRKSHYSSYSKEPGTIGCFSFSSRKRWGRSGNNMH